MKNLQCSHPAIILNPHLSDIVLTHRNYTLRGVDYIVNDCLYTEWCSFFDYGRFGVRKLRITLDDVENSYVIDKVTGEMLPIYMVVPCGKCPLCRDKKAREWVTRAMCESQTSIGQPLFITLTYNDAFLPTDGVCKEHAQGFIKRLRINLNRYLGYDVNLRFFLCSEYGSKTKRPHYHALIWNFPILDSLKRTLSIIERSWSFMVSRSEYDKYPSDFKFRDEHTKRYRVRYGFAYCSIANGQRIKYSMKYMRKDCEIPDGKNSLFYLSSRRRGIGYDWFDKHKQEFYDNPQLLDVQLTDIWSGDSYKGIFPTYYKGLLYPTISRIIPKEIRDAFRLFNYKLNMFNSSLGKWCYKDLYSDDKELIDKYRCLGFHYCNMMPKYYRRVLDLDFKDVLVWQRDEKYDDYTKNLFNELEELRKKLWHYEFDVSDYEDIMLHKQRHQYYVLQYIDSLSDIDISDRLFQLHTAAVRRRNREVL